MQRKYAVELRELLTRLGPSFIKFGQAVSIRPDLLPSSFLFELQKLCDAVPSFPTQVMIMIMMMIIIMMIMMIIIMMMRIMMMMVIKMMMMNDDDNYCPPRTPLP